MHLFSGKFGCRLLALAVLLLVSSGAGAQSQIKPSLWEVRSGDTTAYLFGTIHVGTPDFFPLPDSVESAFRNSDTLAVEIDPGNMQQNASALATAIYMPPDSLESHLDPALVSRIRQVSALYGIQFQQLRQMKPYLLMMTLTMMEYSRLGYDAAYGLDAHFTQRAQREGKRVVELESLSKQLGMLDDLSPQLQSVMLQIAVDDISSGEVSDQVDKMMLAWRNGNTEELREVMNMEQRKLPPDLAKEFRLRFLTERNVAMTQKIDRMLKNAERVFVAVGALHMVGPDSIPALLRKKGYSVKRL